MNEQMIPHTKLRPGAMNVRGDHKPEDIAAMCASLKAEGQMVAIEVRKKSGPQPYEITDGHLRYAAMKKLHGKKPFDARCIVVEATDAEARRRSLTANVMRVAMHPVDEYEAYAELVNDGLTETQVAERFGVLPLDVKKRLRLAHLRADVRDAWRQGKIDVAQAMAFASTSDLAAQGDALKELLNTKDPYHRQPDTIRRKLVSLSVNLNDPVVSFIGGVDAYVADGGTVEEDLFQGVTHLTDSELVRKMTHVKLEQECQRLIDEGWAYARQLQEGELWYQMRRPDVMSYATADDRAALHGKDWNARNDAENAISERAAADPAFRKTAGIIVGFRNGVLDFMGPFTADVAITVDEATDETGSAPADSGIQGADGTAPNDEEEAVDTVSASWPVAESLSVALTSAVGEVLAASPHTALAALVATLRVRLGSYSKTPLRLDPDHRGLAAVGDHTSNADWAAAFTQLNVSPVSEIMREVAEHVSALLDLRHLKMDDRGNWGRRDCIEALASALPPTRLIPAIAERFDEAAYFAKVPVALIDAAVTEMTGKAGRPGKKGEKAAFAVSVAATCGWLPLQLRTSVYTGPGSAAFEAHKTTELREVAA